MSMNNQSRHPYSKPRRPSTSSAARRSQGTPTHTDPKLAFKALCQQCMKYVDHADSVLSTLFITTHSMTETGVLDKLKQKNLKKLQPSEVSSVLMALMNSPIGRKLFPQANEIHHPSTIDTQDPEDE